MKKKRWLIIGILVVIVGLYGFLKPIPDNTNLTGTIYKVPSSDVHFLSDLTIVDDKNVRTSKQQIFDEMFSMIDKAQTYILIDMFLYNDFLGAATESYRGLSQELTNKLIAKKQTNPDIIIQVITDPLNEMYYSARTTQFQALRENNIPVITTDLTKLRDSNPLYSAFWRTFIQWFGASDSGGWLPHPLQKNGQKIGLRSYLALVNFKANHRKVVMTDSASGYSVLIASANPHDGSSAHSNSAIRLDSQAWQDIIKGEKSVAEFSDTPFIDPPELSSTVIPAQAGIQGNTNVQIITEQAIRDRLLSSINALQKDDTLDMAMFYIADRKIIKALKNADERGVKLRLLFDPSKDAFGRQKNGLPNRQVASELMKHTERNTQIRWCDTHGEQCHSKLTIMKSKNGYEMILGSANLTRRNIGNFNLETNAYIQSAEKIKAFEDAYTFFNTTWNNPDGKFYSTTYDAYQDDSITKKLRYHIKEFLGTNRW